jgi:uncharacterized protein (UPF0276 family)
MVVAGVGVGLRPELTTELLRDPARVDFLEVVAESLEVRSDWRREAHALRERWPLVVHGVKLSLASADGVGDERVDRLAALARELRAPAVSEHVALTRAGGRDIGHLTAVPFTREAVAVVARNVARTRARLPDVPFLLENVAWTLRYPHDAMSEGEFHHEVVRATGCSLLLDVANVYANARNAGLDPLALVDSYPLDAVAMVHVAGGVLDDGFWYDTHAHDVPVEVFGLLERVLERCGRVPVVLERDGAFPAFEHTARELDALRARLEAAPSTQARARSIERASVRGARSDAALASPSGELLAEQTEVANALVGDGVAPFDPPAFARTRAVLREKRIDDALPLLPRLGRRRHLVEPLARAGLVGWPRPAEFVGPSDALRIAEEAALRPELADDARWDRLLLRARFLGPTADGGVRPRALPFVGHERIGVRTVWATKGPGATATVRLWSKGGLA